MKTLLSFIAAPAILLSMPSIAHADTLEEELAEMESKFKAADTNNDGRLTKQEAKDGDMGRVARFFGRIDKEDRGYLTLEQLQQRIHERHD